MTILWDATEAWCALLARALHHEFAALCTFAEIHDTEAIEAAFLELPPHVRRERLVRGGGITVALPSGTFIDRVEQNPKILFWDIRVM